MKHQCENCKRIFVDNQITRRKKVLGSENEYVENEFIPLCGVCAKKWIKAERKKAWLGQAIASGWLTQTELEQYGKKEICEQNLFLLIQERKRKENKVREKLELEKC